MLNTKVGYSQNSDSFTSGSESAKMANLEKAKVGLLFTSVVNDQAKIVEGIRSISDAHVLQVQLFVLRMGILMLKLVIQELCPLVAI